MPRIRAPRWVRRTFAMKLLVAGIALSIVLIGSVSAFLFLSRDQQTQQAAQSNATNRAVLLRQLIQKVTVPEVRFAAEEAASLQSIRTALAGPTPKTSVPPLFEGTSATAPLLSDDFVAVFDKDGNVLFSSEPSGVQHLSSSNATIKSGLNGIALEGVENIGTGDAAYDIAVPVFLSSGSKEVVGVIAYSAPISGELSRFGAAATYPTAYIPADGSGRMDLVTTRESNNKTQVVISVAALPDALTGQVSASASGSDTVSAIYNRSGVGDVAGDFVALAAPDHTTAGYIGVELPLSDFSASETNDKLTVGAIAMTAIVVTALLVYMFVNAFVRRPVSTLQRGVARIASGDYTSDITLRSEDELGDLAASVNRMRLQIASYIRHIDGAVARLSDVSRALTTTGAGVSTLQRAVLTAARGMVGGSGDTALLALEDDALTRVASDPPDATGLEMDDAARARIMEGEHLRWQVGERHLLAVPMHYQQQVVGALVVSTERETQESDERALVALANNATIALENTRLFEQEKETVARLRELDAMKSDFLSNVQHELRTPVMAIMGQIELMTVAWDKWDDAMKRDLMKDMEIYTRQLKQIVDVMIDFSLFSSETLQLKQSPLAVESSVQGVVAEMTEGFKGQLPIHLNVAIPSDLFVQADPARFSQVIQALLDNSVKFTKPGGHVAIRATAEGEMAKIQVQDDGIGIPSEAIPRIFEQFYQADSSKTRTFGGLGMGLALVERLTQAHGATVAVESTVGEGSTFTIMWPLAHEAVATPAKSGGFHFFDPGTTAVG